jgi:hypothetical protein
LLDYLVHKNKNNKSLHFIKIFKKYVITLLGSYFE